MSEAMKQGSPAALTIDDGSRRYPIVNQYGDEVGEFYLNPGDVGIFERYAAMQAEVEAISEPFKALTDAGDMGAFVAATAEAKARMLAAIDKMFGRPGSAARLFGNCHPFTPVDGRFYFDRLLELVGGQIEAAFESEAAKFSAPEVRKYTEGTE